MAEAGETARVVARTIAANVFVMHLDGSCVHPTFLLVSILKRQNGPHTGAQYHKSSNNENYDDDFNRSQRNKSLADKFLHLTYASLM